jgi:hypothetical protein
MARKVTKTPQPKRKSTAARQTASKKPVFSVATIVTIVLFLAMIATVYFVNKNKETDATNATPEAEDFGVVFDTAVTGIPMDIKVEPSSGNAAQIARNSENVWALILPEETEADQGLAEAAATQLGSLQIIDKIADADPSIFGFGNPAFVITVTFDGGKSHTLEVGDSTPTNNGYYVRVDKGDILIVGLSGIDALTNLAAFPPYLSTPTPTPLPPTETPVPPPAEVTVTPTP